MPGGATSDPARTFLMTGFNLSAAEIGRLDGGECRVAHAGGQEPSRDRDTGHCPHQHVAFELCRTPDGYHHLQAYKRRAAGRHVQQSPAARRRGVADHRRSRAEAAARVSRRGLRRAAVRGRDRTRPARDRLARGRRPRQREPAGAPPARRLCRPLSPERRGGGDGVRRSRAAPECRPGVRVVDRCRHTR